MSEKTTVLAIHVYEDQGIEIEMGLDKVTMPATILIGILEQIKFDLLRDQSIIPVKKDATQYDA
jgi:hypothetical protein